MAAAASARVSVLEKFTFVDAQVNSTKKTKEKKRKKKDFENILLLLLLLHTT